MYSFFKRQLIFAFTEKYKQSTNSVPGENGSNPLKGLLGQYNSDSETEDVQQTANKLDDKVNDFLKVHKLNL